MNDPTFTWQIERELHIVNFFSLVPVVPTDPTPRHNSPHFTFSALQISQLEALHLDLLALPALFPRADLLLRSVPVDHNADVVRFPDLHVVLLVHGAAVTLEARVPEADNVTGTDLIILLHRSIGKVGVNEGTVGARPDGEQCVGEWGQEMMDQSVGSAVSNGRVLDSVDGISDAGTELGVGVLELVLAGLVGRGFVPLVKCCVRRILGIELHRDDSLRVVHEEDINVLSYCCFPTPLRCAGFLDLIKEIFPVLEHRWRSIWLCPPHASPSEIDIHCNVSLVRG